MPLPEPSPIPSALLGQMLRQAVEEGTRPWVKISSGSMSPLFYAGDEVQLGAITLAEVRLGAVLVVVDKGGAGLLAHRLRRLEQEEQGKPPRLWLRGDRVLAYDAPLGWEQVVGQVTAVRRPNGHLFPLTPELNERLHQLALGQEKRLACLRQPLGGQSPSWADRVWHKLYFYRAWWLVKRETS
jgi:hypothetical protein